MLSQFTAWEWGFWIAAAALTYTYAGYPLAVWVLSRLRPRPTDKAPITPTVTAVVACHNEAQLIRQRVENLLSCNYPADRLDVIIVSDGSTDNTADVARQLLSPRVRLLELPHHAGKAAALNAGVEKAAGEVLLFADARQRFEPSAVRQLVSNFADPSVGAVSGELVLEPAASSSGQGIGFYWNYEKWIRKSESRFDSTIGTTGAIYALRRTLWKPLPPGTILDDVYQPMQVALGGYRVVLEESAKAYDVISSSHSDEFHRKVRTLTGNYQLCQSLPRLLFPAYRLCVNFWSHKLMRLAAPFLLVALLATSAASSGEGLVYKGMFASQILFYAAVILEAILNRHGKRIRLLNVPYVFSLMNAAALMGLFYFVAGRRDVWVSSK